MASVFQVATYGVAVYGGPDGFDSDRARITLRDSSGKAIARLYFRDSSKALEADSAVLLEAKSGVSKMYLPTAMLPTVVDILRNEKPINITLSAGRVIFHNGVAEPVGEGE